MKKNFVAKATVLIVAVLTLAAWVGAHSYKLPEPPQFTISSEPEMKPNIRIVDVNDYELKRAELYDAALDLCIEASKGAYVWEEWVSEENKRIITAYRVPSLEVLLNAIDEMDSDGCLCDSFDEPLIRFDKAFYEFNKIAKIK